MASILITGGTSGLGYQSAIELAKKGHEITITSRSETKVKLSAKKLSKATGTSVRGMVLDLSDMTSVRNFVKDYPEDSIDVLMNNAGALIAHRQLSKQGIEKTFAGNHVGHFLLTYLMMDRVRNGEMKRVVNVSSAAHYNVIFDFDDYNREKKYSSFRVYSESKLANLFFTFELARKERGITTNALHPGFVATNFAKANGLLYKIGMFLSRPIQRGVKKGAMTQIYLASSEEVADISGKYFTDMKIKPPSEEALKEENWRLMWELSEKLTDVSW